MNDYIENLRSFFPILNEKIEGKNLVYLDNGASAQKPKAMMDAISKFYSSYYSNIHRSAHTMSRLSTLAYENARKSIASFFNVGEDYEIIFTKSTTESLNLIARSCGAKFIREGDCVLLSQMEHHANLVPWQILCREKNAKLIFANIDPMGNLDMQDLEDKLSKNNVKIVSIAQASNVLGTVNNVEEISRLCKKYGALYSVDAAQSSPHFLVDCDKMRADFISISAHKCYSATGLGLLIGRKSLLNDMNVYQAGGDMVDVVDWQSATYKNAPERFEAGTPNIEGAIAFGASVEFLSTLNVDKIIANELAIKDFVSESLRKIKGLRVLGNSLDKLPIFTFVHESIHPHDIASLLDTNGIALRSGNHCAQPLGRLMNAPTSCRASFAMYNTMAEAEYFVERLTKTIGFLS